MIGEGRLIPTVNTIGTTDQGIGGGEVVPILVGLSKRVKRVELIESNVDGSTIRVINIVTDISLGIEEGTNITTETNMGSGGSTEPPSSSITTVRSRGPPVRASLHVTTTLEAVVEELDIIVIVVAPFTRLVLVLGTEQSTLSGGGSATVGAGDMALVLVVEDIFAELIPSGLSGTEGPGDTDGLTEFTVGAELQLVGVVVDVLGPVLLAVLKSPGTITIRIGERLVGGVTTSVRARPALGSNGGLGGGLGTRVGEVRLGNISVRVAVATSGAGSEGAITAEGNIVGEGTLGGETTGNTRVVRVGGGGKGPQPEIVPLVSTVHAPGNELIFFPQTTNKSRGGLVLSPRPIKFTRLAKRNSHKGQSKEKNLHVFNAKRV